MAKLALSRDFLPDYAALEKPVRQKVDAAFAKFEHTAHTGAHLEPIQGARDPRARTIRIDNFWRGVVIAPDKGDTYLLLRVMRHDEATKWVQRNRFTVNQSTGVLEIHDVDAIAAVSDTITSSSPPASADTLFADRSDKDFIQLGLPEELVPILRRVASEDELMALTTVMPPGQGEAVVLLACGVSVEEAWAQLVAGEDPGPVDVEDIDAALERPATQVMFRVVSGDEELHDILSRPFAAWRIFLHPQQRRLAYRPLYNGPVRVTGGAGTGKTVVAMHRARALANQAGSADTGAGAARILFTTFTRNLTAAIEDNLKLLGGPELLDRVEVLNADRLAFKIVRDEEGAAPKVLTDETPVWRDIVDETGIRFSHHFLQQEWRHVVLAQGITARDAYFGARRPGRGVRLSRRDRAQVWKAVEAFSDRLSARGERTYLQLAHDAAGYLSRRSVRPYVHVIVDEAQDLHPTQWRMLRAAAPEGPNDLFIVGDTHQRIYDNRVTLSSVGVNVRGRSHRLRLNYRTTHEILGWSLGLLRGERFDDLDSGEDSLQGYRSELHGSSPVVAGYSSRAAELDALVANVRAWLEDGTEPDEIGVAARAGDVLDQACAALKAAGVPARVTTGRETSAEPSTVAVATMHRMKGLEYRYVCVIDAGKGRLPPPVAVTPEHEDPIAHRQDLQRERCLLYVACTRAREGLRVSWSGPPSPFIEPVAP